MWVAVGVWLVSGVVSSTNRAVAYLSAHQGRKRWSVLALLVVPQVETAPADDETTPPAPQVGAGKEPRNLSTTLHPLNAMH